MEHSSLSLHFLVSHYKSQKSALGFIFPLPQHSHPPLTCYAPRHDNPQVQMYQAHWSTHTTCFQACRKTHATAFKLLQFSLTLCTPFDLPFFFLVVPFPSFPFVFCGRWPVTSFEPSFFHNNDWSMALTLNIFSPSPCQFNLCLVIRPYRPLAHFVWS